MNRALVVVLLFFVHFEAVASEDRLGFWFGTFANKTIEGKLNGHLETQIRNDLDNGVVGQILYRVGLNYQYADSQSAGVLFGIIQTGSQVERRIALQHQMTYLKNDSFELNHRMRLEGRNFENSANDGLRLRYLLRYSHRIEESLSGIIWLEPFMNVSDESESGQAFVERSRFFAGVRTSIFSTAAEIGYLNQSVYRRTQNVSEHLATIYWFF